MNDIIAELRSAAPFSEDGGLLTRAADALEAAKSYADEAADVWKDQIGTHYNGCHVRHVVCLAVLIQHAIEPSHD